MARRIVTAREQVEMLAPWREAAQEAPKKIYRGVRLTNLPPELHQKISDLQQLPMDESEVGQHLKIGPMLLDHLHNTPWKPFANTPDHLAYTGLGRHWSRRKEFAELAASNQVGPGVSVVLEADDPGEHHYDPDRPMVGPYSPDDPTEQENTLLPNTPLNVTSIRLPGKPFEEVLDDPYYHNMEQEYGHPYPGGPRPGVGGIAQDPFAKNPRQAAAFDPMAVTNRLKGEFHDWFDTLPEHRLDELRSIEMHPFMEHHENNPVGHWPTVERFLKDKYPAAHRGFLTGHEDASMWLDNPNNEYEDPMLEGDDEFGSLPPPEPYSSADHQKLGYDPQEVAAGMVLLHNRAHSGRQDSYLDTDKARLVNIFNKRQQMQRNYEQRQTTAAVNQGLLDRLHGEFHDWTKGAIAQGRLRRTPTDPERGHIGNWGTVESFLYDKYPMASLGLDMGMEEAGPTLEGRPPKYLTFQGEQPSYETGPEAHAKYGYDPAEIAAGMLLLHNQSHPLRGDLAKVDQDRLNDIFNKRQKMQRNYENRSRSLDDIFREDEAGLQLLGWRY